MSSAWSFLASCSLMSVLVYGGCERHDVTVEFYLVDGYHFASAERAAIQSIADATAREVRAVLPALPRELVLRVYAGSDVIPETGESGTAVPPATVIWVVDPRRPGGVVPTAGRQLRASLYHELHHLVRYRTVPRGGTLMDDVVSEGMATAFERDFAGATPMWGQYPAEVERWVDELRALSPGVARVPWFVRHPDGRRWIGLRAGTYVIDRVVRRTGESAATLVEAPTQAILDLALAGP